MITLNPILKRRLRFGGLYNLDAVLETDFAPSGWHVADGDDWETLLKMKATFGELDTNNDLGEMCRVVWYDLKSPTTTHTNEVGLSVKPSGFRNHSTGAFASGYLNSSKSSDFWLPFPYNVNNLLLYMHTANFGSPSALNIASQTAPFSGAIGPRSGMSVRLIKDNTTPPANNQLVDLDGNIYKAITVTDGTVSQIWLVENWKCTKLNDGTPIPILDDNTDWTTATGPAMCWFNNDEKLK